MWQLIKSFFNGKQDLTDNRISEKKRMSGAGRNSSYQADGYWFISQTLANVRMTRNVYLRKHQIE